MENQTTKQTIIELIAQQTGLDSEVIDPTLNFEEDLGLTEEDLVTLIKQINHSFEDINLHLDDLTENSVYTVGGLVQLVNDELAFA